MANIEMKKMCYVASYLGKVVYIDKIQMCHHGFFIAEDENDFDFCIQTY